MVRMRWRSSPSIARRGARTCSAPVPAAASASLMNCTSFGLVSKCSTGVNPSLFRAPANPALPKEKPASPSTSASVLSTMAALSRKLGAETGLSDEIAGALRNLILRVESRVARQLGVGQPTVREKLVALEHQGLDSRKANHGCFVTIFTRQEIADI